MKCLPEMSPLGTGHRCIFCHQPMEIEAVRECEGYPRQAAASISGRGKWEDVPSCCGDRSSAVPDGIAPDGNSR